MKNAPLPSRRALLRSAGAGFGHLALSGLLGARDNPLTLKQPHSPTKAKRTIFLFMEGRDFEPR